MKLFVLPLAIFPVIVHAYDCMNKTPVDVRAYCYDITQHKVNKCKYISYISNFDLRAICRAQVTRNTNNCMVIQNFNTRKMCEAISK